MKLKFLILLFAYLTSISSTQAMDYFVTVKGGWGDSRLNTEYTLDGTRFSDEGYAFSTGAGLAFESNFITGIELADFSSDSFFGADDRIGVSENKLYVGYRFNIAPHFRITPVAGILRWKLRAKDGANNLAGDIREGTYRDNDTYTQLNIEFPINSLVSVVSSLNYTKYEFGVVRSAQAGVMFQF